MNHNGPAPSVKRGGVIFHSVCSGFSVLRESHLTVNYINFAEAGKPAPWRLCKSAVVSAPSPHSRALALAIRRGGSSFPRASNVALSTPVKGSQRLCHRAHGLHYWCLVVTATTRSPSCKPAVTADPPTRHRRGRVGAPPTFGRTSAPRCLGQFACTGEAC